MRIPENIIQQVLETARIEEVIGEFVTLKKRGTNYTANCPFHNERTPSFSVSPTKGIYKCFGCGAAGNVTTFLMEHEHFTFPDAIHWLAKKYQIEIPEQEPTQDERNAQQQEASLYIATQFAAEYFTQQLQQTDEGRSVGLSYLQSRGFTPDTITKFQLGYSLENGDSFINAAQSLGYQPDILQKAGLTIQKNDRQIAFFRGRVQFPIHNLSGKVVAFAGRTLLADKKIPKYINSPETDIYNKRKILYGMHLARRAAIQQNECFLVEGYTDVISMHQAGIENVVASSGTSLTDEQAKMIRRYAENVTILYDGDAAGINAALRGIDIVLSHDLNVRLVLLPETDDPDSFVKNKGATAFKDYIQQNAKDFVLFKTDLLLQQAANDPIKRAEVARNLIDTLVHISDNAKRSAYIKSCSQKLKIDEQIIINEVNKKKIQQAQKSTQAPTPTPDTTSPTPTTNSPQSETNRPLIIVETDACEQDILKLLLEYGEKPYDDEYTVAIHVIHEIGEIPFRNSIYKEILNIYITQLNQTNSYPTSNYFVQHPNSVIKHTIIHLLASPYNLSENWENMHQIFVKQPSATYKRATNNLLLRFKLRHVVMLIEENLQHLSQTDNVGNQTELLILQQKLAEWQKTLAQQLNIGLKIR